MGKWIGFKDYKKVDKRDEIFRKNENGEIIIPDVIQTDVSPYELDWILNFDSNEVPEEYQGFISKYKEKLVKRHFAVRDIYKYLNRDDSEIKYKITPENYFWFSILTMPEFRMIKNLVKYRDIECRILANVLASYLNQEIKQMVQQMTQMEENIKNNINQNNQNNNSNSNNNNNNQGYNGGGLGSDGNNNQDNNFGDSPVGGNSQSGDNNNQQGDQNNQSSQGNQDNQDNQNNQNNQSNQGRNQHNQDNQKQNNQSNQSNQNNNLSSIVNELLKNNEVNDIINKIKDKVKKIYTAVDETVGKMDGIISFENNIIYQEVKLNKKHLEDIKNIGNKLYDFYATDDSVTQTMRQVPRTVDYSMVDDLLWLEKVANSGFITTEHTSKICVDIYLDISGSMSGNRFEFAKGVIIELLKKGIKFKSIYVFENELTKLNSVNELLKIRNSGGGTNITNVLENISKSSRKVLIISDLEDSVNRELVEKNKNKISLILIGNERYYKDYWKDYCKVSFHVKI